MPPARTNPQIAYDSKTGTLLLFGGFGFYGDLNDTWVWDGIRWTQLHPVTSPVARTGASMVYDAATSQIVLFGGCTAGCNGAQILGDTWTWDGKTWTLQHPTTSPPPRLDASMTYDAATQTVVLFGGGGNGPRVYRSFPPLQDTWTWNGTTWIQQHPAISPPSSFSIEGNALSLSGTSMTYNNATNQIVLMLSARDNDSGDHKTQVSWIWDGKTWTRQAIQNPGADQAILTYVAAQQTILEFSDTLPHNGNFIDKLCKWTDQGWQELAIWS